MCFFSLVEMLGGEVDFSVYGLMRCFEAEFTLAFVNVNGLEGAGALREPIDSKDNLFHILHFLKRLIGSVYRRVQPSSYSPAISIRLLNCLSQLGAWYYLLIRELWKEVGGIQQFQCTKFSGFVPE